MYFKIKNIKGKKYLYLIKNKRVNGKVKRVFEKCIGNAEKVYEILTSKHRHTKVASFSFGKTAALLHASEKLNITTFVK